MPKTPTPKKKSKSSSPARKTTDRGLHIIDVNGGKLVARVLSESASEFVLTRPASLSFPIAPLDGGRRFAIKATLMGIVGVDAMYYLPKSAVRGYTTCSDAWLTEVYARFEQRAAAGEFRLNPYAAPERVELMQGTGEVEGETGDVTVIHANTEPAAPTEAPDA